MLTLPCCCLSGPQSPESGGRMRRVLWLRLRLTVPRGGSRSGVEGVGIGRRGAWWRRTIPGGVRGQLQLSGYPYQCIHTKLVGLECLESHLGNRKPSVSEIIITPIMMIEDFSSFWRDHLIDHAQDDVSKSRRKSAPPHKSCWIPPLSANFATRGRGDQGSFSRFHIIHIKQFAVSKSLRVNGKIPSKFISQIHVATEENRLVLNWP